MSSSREIYQEWYKAQLDNSEALIDSVEEARTAIVPAVANNNLAQTALSIIQDTLPFVVSAELTPAQHRAAFLIGCGVEWQEAEEMLRLPVGKILEWRQSIPGFRTCVHYYRDVKTEQIQGKMIRNVELLIDDPDLDCKIKTSLLSVAQKLVSDSSRDRLAQAQIALQVEALNRQTVGVFRPVGLTHAPKVIEGDFSEIIEEEQDD